MKKIILALAIFSLIVASLACRTLVRDATPGPYEALCRESVDGMNALLAGLKIPDYFQQENPVKQGGEFDPNRYFEVLTHLKMRAGYALDYVYQFDGLGGYPLLYARPVAGQPFQTAEEFLAAKPATYLETVETDGTPEGYLQLALLERMGGQFYLFWHAGYNDLQVLCGASDIDQVISANEKWDFGVKLNAVQKLQARAIDRPGPVVEFQDGRVTVSLLTFTNWGGFIRRTYTINQAFPHQILEVKKETLVEYNCGVMF